jgi:hypothetical protein
MVVDNLPIEGGPPRTLFLRVLVSLLLYIPSAWIVASGFGHHDENPLAIAVFIGIYSSSLLVLWTRTDREVYLTSWSTPNGREKLYAIIVILVPYAPGVLVALVIGAIASNLPSSMIYGAVALAYNSIPASVAVTLLTLGYLKAGPTRGERFRDIFIVAFTGVIVTFLFVTQPFLQYPRLLALEIAGATAYAILRSFKIKGALPVILLCLFSFVIFIGIDNLAAGATERLYLKFLG